MPVSQTEQQEKRERKTQAVKVRKKRQVGYKDSLKRSNFGWRDEGNRKRTAEQENKK